MKEHTIPLKEWMSLIGVTISAFIFNTSEFMPIGLLTDIASDFQITEASVGFMISAYAWVVAIFSLPLMLAVSTIELRRLLLGVLTVFGIGQILSCTAVTYTMLVLARICVASAHCIFWSIAAPIATRLVSQEHRPLALSMVATGTSIAMIVGLPLGRFIGLLIGWRMTFLCVAAATLLVCVYLLAVFPKLPVQKAFSLQQLPELLHNRALMGIYFLVLLFATSYYTGYSYIEPFLQQVARLSDTWITVVLTIFGAAGMAGSILFSKLYNHTRFIFLRVMIVGMAASLLLLYPASVTLVTILVLCIFWGIVATAFNVAFQAEVIQCVGLNASAVAMSIFSGIFNLGIGSGTWIGGVVTTYSSIAYIGYAGGSIAALASVFCVGYLIGALKQR